MFEKLMTHTVNIFVLKKKSSTYIKMKIILYSPANFFCENKKKTIIFLQKPNGVLQRILI
jgi:hypothetical protein